MADVACMFLAADTTIGPVTILTDEGACRLRDSAPEFKEATCLAIACPACMTLELARSCAQYVTSLVNNTDIIPTISPGAHYFSSSFTFCVLHFRTSSGPQTELCAWKFGNDAACINSNRLAAIAQLHQGLRELVAQLPSTGIIIIIVSENAAFLSREDFWRQMQPGQLYVSP